MKKILNHTAKELVGIIVVFALVATLIAVGSTAIMKQAASKQEQSKGQQQKSVTNVVENGTLSHDGYKLEKVVVLSRHNIRSPLSGGGSLLGTITPHEWFEWSSAPSELSLRGGVLETEMGQFFRKWMEEESLIPENWHPTGEECRIYANSKQRTIATAKYFSSGAFPTAGLDVEWHADFDTMDPVFNPQLTFTGDEYADDATEQIFDLYGPAIEGLKDNYELITDVIDMEESESYKSGDVGDFVTSDSVIKLETGAEPAMSGSLKTACSVSDALVLQYYEESDAKKAGFGNGLSQEQWESISEIKDVYGDVLFTAPLVACNVANPLLEEIYSEMNTDGRVFTFLCGHDSNVGSVLAALGASSYELPGTIEKKTPIGCKLVFSKWTDSKGETFWGVNLVYQSTQQLRDTSLLDLNKQPMIYNMKFDGISQNSDGLYKNDDIMKMFEDAIGEYEKLYEQYADKAA
ncbi:histidine-type phosphatase [Butyrivibrio sp. WCD2001]|uniref:histidine-type phosphatase n=1 Tax=Butyrivibrio sp. WCD2001 TaxID=1280681 RepID=UPI00042618FF|nr:histidine-type phosphatase [Butyrivibrio sp. WCD2001]